jgi:site-specific DNA-methyltransferase (adenine-specific)
MNEQITFNFTERPTIKGFPELRWTGKRPYRSTQFFPAQLRERYGEESADGWINKIFWGDNLQVMSHLLKNFRGKVDLIYIDPPFDSKADYKKKISLRGQTVTSDSSSFEEKQYGDIWTNDEYLQFMYERLIIMRELLSEKGSIYVHCDWHKNHHLRMIMDEIFGIQNFNNEIIWCYSIGGKSKRLFGRKHDTILWYSKTSEYTFNAFDPKVTTERKANSHMRVRTDDDGRQYQEKTDKKSGKIYRYYVDEGKTPEDYWIDIEQLNREDAERGGYPTQKPERLLERIISASTNPGDLVFDCFMGSGTTQAVAMKLSRRFIGADINLGAIQTTTKRLIGITGELIPYLVEKNNETSEEETPTEEISFTGFEVYNVNNYDFFRNPVEARDLLIEALEIQPFPQSVVWDGELDGRMAKIMPVNRIATKADLEELKANLPYKTYEKRKEENPNQPVEKITLVCMGHEPDLRASLEAELSEYKLDIEIVDILRDKTDLQLKREAEADITIEGGRLVIREFYPLNLMQKLSLQKEYVEDWRQLVESIMIDWNYDGVFMQPTVTDVPGKTEMVTGIYDIPEGAGTIKVKITDLLSESLEKEVR